MIEHSTEYTDHNLQGYNCCLITLLTTFLLGDYLHSGDVACVEQMNFYI